MELHVRNEFEIETKEHTLEVYAHESDKTRALRRKLAYENSSNKYIPTDREIANITAVQIQATTYVMTYLKNIIMEYIRGYFA